ncbi:hypothetical protein SEA_LUCKYSOCKE_192 [Streptomyces phage LuckySocke]|jgi:hypothetical protein|nr:hypothetical protein SEA_LUCKYSOCKE_192 [Streptomyces phage LuckySocke]
MRDIVRDAAIITTAKAYREANTPLETYLDLYEDKDSELPEYVMDLLFDLDMIKQEYVKIPVWSAEWSLDRDSKYVWVWK